MPSQFSIILSGNYDHLVQARKEAMLIALKEAVTDAAEDIKLEVRRDVKKAGFTDPVPNLIQDEVYPDFGLAYSPSAQVFATAPNIIAPPAYGLTVKAKTAEALAIPLTGTPAETLKRRRGQSRIQAAKEKFGALKLLKRPGKTSLLAADDKSTPEEGDVIPLFSLPDEANHPKRLRTIEIFNKAERTFPQLVLFKLAKQLDISVQKTAIRS